MSPSVKISTLRYGSISAIRRAAAIALLTPRSKTVAGIRLRFDSSMASKSQRRSSPHSPSTARVWAIAWPTLNPTTAILTEANESCSA